MESNDNGEEAVDDLLEECWFFENLLKRRTAMMLRCNSDPCPSSSKMSQDGGSEINSSSLAGKEGDDHGDGVARRGLIRAPSLPPSIGRKEEKLEKPSNGNAARRLLKQPSHKIMLQPPKPSCNNSSQEKESGSRIKFSGKAPCRKLKKAPSLPTNIGREEDMMSCQDTDSDARMSRLIQLAFSSSAESLHPKQSSKGMIHTNYDTPMARPPRSSEAESYNTTGIKEMNRRYPNQQQKTMIKKSINDLETEEVQGFKDLGFSFEKKDLSPSVVSILPGLQEQNQKEWRQDSKMRKPYLSEAWPPQSSAPPVPNWVPKNSSGEIKAQLQFWARAVASNVRQEC